MQEAPKVSILVPIYNVERYLRQCLDSLTGQTLREIEIICVDDGSTDTGGQILAEYAAKDPRILVMAQQNAGQAAARNRALARAGAPYIMFCDADDWYEPDMCAKLLAALEGAPEAAYAVCGIDVAYECHQHMARADARYYRVKYSGELQLTEKIILDTDVSPCNKIFRKELIDKYRLTFPEGLKYEDCYFFHIYAILSSRAVYMEDKLYHYLRRFGSTMSYTFEGNSDYIPDHLAIAERICQTMKSHGVLDTHLHYFGELFFKLLDTALCHSVSGYAREQLFAAAERLLQQEQIDFSAFRDLAYLMKLVQQRRIVGSERKKWFGLLTIKQKRTCVKDYLCGIPVWKK